MYILRLYIVYYILYIYKYIFVYFDPKYYDSVIKAVHDIAGYDSETGIFKAPTNASNLGTWLKMLGHHLLSLCIRTHDTKRKENVEEFLKLHEEEFSAEVSRTVVETQLKNDCKKKTILTSDRDIKKLNHHLDITRREAYINLKEYFIFSVWSSLAETTLLSIQLFNRRRPGEMERVLINDYKSYETIDIKSQREI